MTKTRADLVNQCLYNLGVIAQGQVISVEEVNKMDALVDPSISMLADLDIYYVSDIGDLGPSGGEIADSAFLPIADYIANSACAAFNLPADTKMQALSMIAEAKLRTLSAPSRTLRFLRVDPALRGVRRGYYRGGF